MLKKNNATTMNTLRKEWEDDGVVIRYKGFVIVAEFVSEPNGEYYECNVWAPELWVDADCEDISEILREEGMDFCALDLFKMTDLDGEAFETEGEAIEAGIDYIKNI